MPGLSRDALHGCNFGTLAEDWLLSKHRPIDSGDCHQSTGLKVERATQTHETTSEGERERGREVVDEDTSDDYDPCLDLYRSDTTSSH